MCQESISICGRTSHKILVNFDAENILKPSHVRPPDTKQINSDPQNGRQANFDPHTKIKPISTTQTKNNSISILTLKASDLRPASKNGVNFDHHYHTKPSQSIITMKTS